MVSGRKYSQETVTNRITISSFSDLLLQKILPRPCQINMLQSIGYRRDSKHQHLQYDINLLSQSPDYFILFNMFNVMFLVLVSTLITKGPGILAAGRYGWESLSKLKLLPDNQIFIILKKNKLGRSQHHTVTRERNESLFWKYDGKHVVVQS